MPKFFMKKLVRDQVLQRCLDDPKVQTHYHLMTDKEYKHALLAKLHEEADEIPLRESVDDDVVSEIADVLTVVNALRDSYGISQEELERVYTRKIQKNGGFSKKAYIESVDLDDSSEWIEHFRKSPDKYKETDQ